MSVPNNVTSTQARPHRTWPWIIIASASAIFVVVLGVAVFAVCTSIARELVAGTCLPKDFPTYPGATTTNVSVYTGTGGSTCTMAFDSSDSADQVARFYLTHLNEDDWLLVATDPTNGTIAFQRHSQSRDKGQIQIYGRGLQSSYQVQYRS